jgi:hypothetical protein
MPLTTPPNSGLHSGTSPLEVGADTFAAAIATASRAIRRCFAEAFGAVGCDPAVPTSVSRRLGLDKSLAWKAARIVTDPDVLSIPKRLPGREGMRLFCAALQTAGASAASIDALRASVEHLRDIEVRFAHDRDAFEAMLAGATDGATDESFRRPPFSGNSALWGVRAKAQLSLFLLAPGSSRDTLHVGNASGFIDFQRLRPEVPWTVATLRSFAGEGTPLNLRPFTPIDEQGMTDGVPLLREFSSTPLPPMRSVTQSDGTLRLVLSEGPIGRAGSASVLVGRVERDSVSAVRTPEDSRGAHYLYLSTPVEYVVHDLYVHRDLALPAPTSGVYGMLPGGPLFPRDDEQTITLPVGNVVQDLGEPADPTMPEFSGAHALLERIAGALGHRADEFRGYRVRLRYPPIPAVSTISFDLPQRAQHTPL